jgi:hypothetical protein
VRRRSTGLVLAVLVWVTSLVPVSGGVSPPAAAQTVDGRILAPAGRQLAWLDLCAPRPQLLTHFEQPAYVTDVVATPGAPLAAIGVSRPLGQGGAFGGDLLAIDLASAQLSTLVGRTDSNESLGAPAWWFDGSGLLFERQDRSVNATSYAGMSTAVYPTRIEMVQPDGSNRTVLVQNGRLPAPAPDASGLVFVRTSSEGTSLIARTFSDPSERVIIPASRFRDLASPRYSPQGDRLALMAPGTFIGGQATGLFASSLFGPAIASAHGLSWDVWVVGTDGSDMHLLAEIGADDGTLAWSPDGSQIFVYGGTGSYLVSATTGHVTPLAYLVGYGSTAWLPG